MLGGLRTLFQKRAAVGSYPDLRRDSVFCEKLWLRGTGAELWGVICDVTFASLNDQRVLSGLFQAVRGVDL